MVACCRVAHVSRRPPAAGHVSGFAPLRLKVKPVRCSKARAEVDSTTSVIFFQGVTAVVTAVGSVGGLAALLLFIGQRNYQDVTGLRTELKEIRGEVQKIGGDIAGLRNIVVVLSALTLIGLGVTNFNLNSLSTTRLPTTPVSSDKMI